MIFSIAQKISLGAVFLVLASAGAVGALFYNGTANLLLENALEDIAKETRTTGDKLQVHIKSLHEDVLFLSNTPPIQGMLRAKNNNNYDPQGKSSYTLWVQRLQSIFATIIESKPAYIKLRFIDKQGQELVAVSRTMKRINILSGAQLQNKSQREYVTNTVKLAVGSVYLSEINLNREHGNVSFPHREVLRSATPVYSETSGKVVGLVVITAEIGRELRKIQKNIDSAGREIYITNDNGDYLLHPDASKTYGFDLTKPFRIQQDIPQTSKLFFPGNTDTQVTFDHKTNDQRNVVNFTKIPFDISHPERFIAVTMTQTYSSIAAEQSALLSDLKFWALFLVLAGIGSAVFLAVRITQPIKQITQVVDDFTHERVTSAIMPVELRDEIGVLARSFDSMIHQVEETQANLSEANNNLEQLVSERTRLLQDSEAQQSTILEAIADAIITIDNKGKITSFNPAAVKTFGYREQEVVGQNVSVLLPETERQEHQEFTTNSSLYSQRIIGENRELEGLRKDGSLFPLELNVAALQGKAKRGYVGVLRDITDRRQAKHDLIIALEDAKSANSAKSEFLSSMSHELRTPMNAIMGFSQLLQIDNNNPLMDEQRENVDEIIRASKHLMELINEVLDLARVESGRIELSIEPVVLSDAIVESLQLISPLALNRGIEINLKSEDKDITIEQLLEQHYTVKADRIRLKQVLLNLLSNAVKYNHENGKLIINCHYENNITRISVTDTGNGLSPEQQTQLFKSFNRLGAEQTSVEGTGIGLVITKNIVELMGGKIGVDSQTGKGSTFWIELPSDTVASAQKIDLVNNISKAPQDINSSKQQNTILYIEDNPANLRLVNQLLGRRSNIRLWSAHEPLLGLELAAEHKPDLILLDINLPGMDGFEVLKQLRLRQVTRDTPVIAISANVMSKDIEKGLTAGFDDYITKPINVTRLLQAVETICMRI